MQLYLENNHLLRQQNEQCPCCLIPKHLIRHILCGYVGYNCIGLALYEFPVGTRITFPNGEELILNQHDTSSELDDLIPF